MAACEKVGTWLPDSPTSISCLAEIHTHYCTRIIAQSLCVGVMHYLCSEERAEAPVV